MEEEVAVKAEWRRFTGEYKLKVCARRSSASSPGRSEDYSRGRDCIVQFEHLAQAARAWGTGPRLSANKRGPRKREKNPLAERVRELERDNARVKRRRSGPRGSWSCKKNFTALGNRTATGRRARLMAMVSDYRTQYSVQSICAALGMGRASFYRWQRPGRGVVRERIHPRASSVASATTWLAGSSKQPTVFFGGGVYATLLHEGGYLCSERTMYRILSARQQVRER
jgi:transposase-like protein